jgi:hypothetical protein
MAFVAPGRKPKEPTVLEFVLERMNFRHWRGGIGRRA